MDKLSDHKDFRTSHERKNHSKTQGNTGLNDNTSKTSKGLQLNEVYFEKVHLCFNKQFAILVV